jgi:hypothetical protein
MISQTPLQPSDPRTAAARSRAVDPTSCPTPGFSVRPLDSKRFGRIAAALRSLRAQRKGGRP